MVMNEKTKVGTKVAKRQIRILKGYRIGRFKCTTTRDAFEKAAASFSQALRYPVHVLSSNLTSISLDRQWVRTCFLRKKIIPR